MSGVSRLAAAQRTYTMPVKTTGGAHEDSKGAVKVNVNVGSGLAPKKARPQFDTEPFTGVPKGRALPVRGEGPTTNAVDVSGTPKK